MSKYKFETDYHSEDRCDAIARKMVILFNISKEEAIARVNQQWKGQSFINDWTLDHIDTDEWAKNIYWESDSYWWITGETREQLKLPPLTPKQLRK